MAWHPNSHYVAGGYADGEVRLFDVRTGGVVRILAGKHSAEEGGVSSLAFDATGRRLASGGHDGRVAVWDLRSGKADETCSASLAKNKHSASVTALDWAPRLEGEVEAAVLVSGSTDCTVKMWPFYPSSSSSSTSTSDGLMNGDDAEMDGHNDNDAFRAVRTFKTKRTPICHLSFCRADVAVCVGSYFPGEREL